MNKSQTGTILTKAAKEIIEKKQTAIHKNNSNEVKELTKALQKHITK